MTIAESVTASVEVGVDPSTAFDIFTREIDRWWRPGPINWYDSSRAVGTRFEPGVGGRWLEVYDEANGDVLEIARITAWEPGKRLVLDYLDGGHDLSGTEIEIRFEPVEGGTRVTLDHRGWDGIAPEIASRSQYVKRWGWTSIVGWYKEWVFWGSPLRVRSGVEVSA